MPIEYVYHLSDAFDKRDPAAVIKCVAGKGIRGLRHSIGYLNISSTEATFICRRLLRLRHYTVPRDQIEHVHFKKHLLMDRLTLRINGKQHVFYLFKDISNRGEMISRALRSELSDYANIQQTRGVRQPMIENIGVGNETRPSFKKLDTGLEQE